MKTMTRILPLALLCCGAATAQNVVLHEHDGVGDNYFVHEVTNRGHLGVHLHAVESIDGEGRSQGANGIYVMNVVEGGAAEAAGIRKKDRLVAVDGRAIATMHDLHSALDETEPGDRIDVDVLRGSEELRFRVELTERPDEEIALLHHKLAVERAAARPFIGIETQRLEGDLADYFDVEQGLLISRVVEDSPAAEAGLEAGDVIVAWDDQPIAHSKDLYRMLRESEAGDRPALAVSRRGVVSDVFVTLGENRELHELHFGETGEFKLRRIERRESKD